MNFTPHRNTKYCINFLIPSQVLTWVVKDDICLLESRKANEIFRIKEVYSYRMSKRTLPKVFAVYHLPQQDFLASHKLIVLRKFIHKECQSEPSQKSWLLIICPNRIFLLLTTSLYLDDGWFCRTLCPQITRSSKTGKSKYSLNGPYFHYSAKVFIKCLQACEALPDCAHVLEIKFHVTGMNGALRKPHLF